MKRTVEVVLGVIGAIIYGLFAALGGTMIWLQNNEQVIQDIFDQTAEQNPELNMGDISGFADTMGAGGWMLLIVSLIAIILGILAMVFLRNNRKPKAAGIIFIATAVIVAIVTLGAGIIPGLFYLIAGIMCFTRKQSKVL